MIQSFEFAPGREDLMSDTNERLGGLDQDLFDKAEGTAKPIAHEGIEAGGEELHVNGTWRKEAGRKGAHRIHELIEAGKRYELEHGLKSGRQRLRQLIELGKLYEEEQGRKPVVKERKGGRLSRMERDEVVATLLNCLVRMVKPSFRPELERLAAVLSEEPETSQAA